MLLATTRQRGLAGLMQRPLGIQLRRFHATSTFWQDQDEQRKRRSVDYKLRGKVNH
jgi:hypothetical protein